MDTTQFRAHHLPGTQRAGRWGGALLGRDLIEEYQAAIEAAKPKKRASPKYTISKEERIRRIKEGKRLAKERRKNIPGGDIVVWRQDVKLKRGFDPMVFLDLIQQGKFKIKSKDAAGRGVIGIDTFEPRNFQKQWYERILDHRMKGSGRFSVLVVKSRQLGFSVGHDVFLVAEATGNAGASVLITAHRNETLRALSDNVRIFVGRKRDKDRLNRMADGQFEAATGSTIRLLGAKDSLGRGDAALHLHVSEADYIEDIDAALDSVLPAIDRSEMATVVLESTIRAGSTTGFKDFLKRSMRGRTSYQVVFLSWVDDESASVRLRPSERDALVASLNPYERELLDGWTAWNGVFRRCTIEQVAWWRRRFEEDARSDMARMIEMYPRDLLEVVRDDEQDDFIVESELAWQESQIAQPVRELIVDITASVHSRPAGSSDAWHIPRLKVWTPPEAGEAYVAGVDCVDADEGSIGNENYIVVMRNDGTVVATWSGRTSGYQCVNALAVIGFMYNTALVGVERNVGLGILTRLYDVLRYPRIYVPTRARGPARGLHVSKQVRSALVDMVRMLVNERRVVLRDAKLVEQLRTFARLRGQKKTAGRTKKDGTQINPQDGIDALGICALIMDNARTWRPREALESPRADLAPEERKPSMLEEWLKQRQERDRVAAWSSFYGG